MEVAMLYHPYIMELLVKEMQRELLAEANRTHQIRAVQTGRSLTVKLKRHQIEKILDVMAVGSGFCKWRYRVTLMLFGSPFL